MNKDIRIAEEKVERIQSKNRLQNARAGEIWVINDKKTRGHKSSILSNNKADRKRGEVKHAPITHAPKTRGSKNIKLQENPQSGKKTDNRESYILAKAQNSKNCENAKKREDVKIKNPIDKAIRRHIRKVSKRQK